MKNENGFFSKQKFNPDHLRYHVFIALGGTILLLIIILLLLRVFTRHGKEIQMPSYIGQNAEELTQHKGDDGFIFVISDYLYKEGVKPGIVLKQNPVPNEHVKKGRKIYLTVSASEPPMIQMPELRDVSQRQAQIMLEAQGLVLDQIIEKPSPYDNAVLDQLYKGHSIAPGTKIKMGEKISLVVGRNIGGLPEDSTANEEEGTEDGVTPSTDVQNNF